MEDHILNAIRQKLGDAIRTPFPPLVRREAEPALLQGKAQAVVGMRRAGKTFFLFQCLADRLAGGIERERLVYFNFEDERLGGLRSEELGTIIEEYYRQFPQFRNQAEVTWCLDEIQLVPGWERFVRRVLDSERAEVFVSGSSAHMLSREVATSMRGRAMEVVITPFSFREFLRGRNWLEDAPGRLASGAERSALRAHFDAYLETGGFPEARVFSVARDRVGLLQGYVDAVLFRDVAERHHISNLPALRAFVRQLLRQPAALLSVSKVYADFASRGIAVSKETLLGFLAHLEDAFLVFTLPLAGRSERQRQVNPRKLYLADHGLAQAFSPAPGLDRGRLIENVVACELRRTSRDLAYARTASGLEVDFVTTDFEGRRQLIQAAADISSPATFEREMRALTEARLEFPDAAGLLVAEAEPPHGVTAPEGIQIVPVWEWLLTR
ncbi:MAG TPA: ATP-binding protein [Candidatus Paceibacterota bacterium]|nr:ATP-binding protein [Verrucomicrobiota bacterium]HRZ44856.1 ATP-binding protein [Candidatus Paceibacterota bacterium]